MTGIQWPINSSLLETKSLLEVGQPLNSRACKTVEQIIELERSRLLHSPLSIDLRSACKRVRNAKNHVLTSSRGNSLTFVNTGLDWIRSAGISKARADLLPISTYKAIGVSSPRKEEREERREKRKIRERYKHVLVSLSILIYTGYEGRGLHNQLVQSVGAIS